MHHAGMSRVAGFDAPPDLTGRARLLYTLLVPWGARGAAAYRLLLVTSIFLLAGCPESSARCVPGEQRSCPCLGGSAGIQICGEDGRAYSECVCSPDASLPDASLAVDAALTDAATTDGLDGATAADGQVDSSPFMCADDSAIEPNDTLATAFQTPVMEDLPMVSYASLAICPDTDIDLFRISIDQPNQTLRVEMSYDSGQGMLRLEILNSTGIVIREGTAVEGDPDLVRAEVPNIALGLFYGQVRSSGAGIENNYSLSIQTF